MGNKNATGTGFEVKDLTQLVDLGFLNLHLEVGE